MRATINLANTCAGADGHFEHRPVVQRLGIGAQLGQIGKQMDGATTLP